MSKLIFAALTAIAIMSTQIINCQAASPLQASQLNGAKETDFWGYPCYDFKLASGVSARVASPREAASGRPWIWRARFWGHEPQTDLALLQAGFHVVYVEVGDLFGNAEAVARFNEMYAFLTGEEVGLNRKCVLEGMSRGGLIIFNWAADNADKVAAIYADAPVCDINQWPLSESAVTDNPDSAFQMCLKAYGMTLEEARAYERNPYQYAARKLGEANIPILSVCGAQDNVVPMEGDILRFQENYQKAGGTRLQLVEKPGCWHHHHSLQDPSVIVNFIKANAVGYNDFIRPRGGIANALATFRDTGKGTVAFLGGSIVEMNGFSRLTEENLRRLFPQCEFKFINAGISSTCSDTGAFRLERDVLSKGAPDLLFVEFATNDNGDGFNSADHAIRAMEGIVRRARQANPAMDIVFVYTADDQKIQYVGNVGAPYMQSGVSVSIELPTRNLNHMVEYENIRPMRRMHPVIASHEAVAEHYGLPSIDFNGDVEERMYHGIFGWKTFGGIHPAPYGAAIYADDILCFVRGELERLPADAAVVAHGLPQELDKFSYSHGVLLAPEAAHCGDGWQVCVPDWENIPGAKRSRYTSCQTLCSSTPGAVCTLDFRGTAIGIFLSAGADAGMIEYRVDGGNWQSEDLFSAFSGDLHYPYTMLLADGLEADKPHTLEIKVLAGHNPKSVGNAVRIMNFTLNQQL